MRRRAHLAAHPTHRVAVQIVGGFLGTFKEYPPSQRVGSMNLDVVMEQLQSAASGAGK